MRKLFIIIFCLISLQIGATKYYVTPRGNDANTGADTTSAHAWKTWHYAFNHVTPSDTVYFRGGTYPAYSTTIGAQLKTTSVNGTHDNPTCFFALPSDWAAGNYPVLDCDIMTRQDNQGIEISRASNIHFKGLTVKNVHQINVNLPAEGWYITNEGLPSSTYAPNNITFENCTVHHIGGHGFTKVAADTLYFINCDAYMLCDTLVAYDPGGSGTGYTVGGRSTQQDDGDLSYTYFHGCRSWKASDQGWSIVSNGTVVMDSCWSVNNGNFGIGLPKGSGIKLWYNNFTLNNDNVVQITIRNSLFVDNEYFGINWTDRGEPSQPEIRCHIYNNFIYRNGKYHVSFTYGGITTGGWTGGLGIEDDDDPVDTVGQWDHWYWNNLSFDNYGVPFLAENDNVSGVYNEATNKWDLTGTTISAADFVSLDTTGLCGARQASGELPITTFGHLASTSECINAGTDVGLPYDGLYPDIGWAEYQLEAPPAAPLVSTLTPYAVNSYSARTGGYMLYDGGQAITAKGICWGEDADPDLTDNVVVAGSGVADYIVTLGSLSSNITYHVRAYATNSVTTTYGEDEDFTTTKSAIVKYRGKIVKR